MMEMGPSVMTPEPVPSLTTVPLSLEETVEPSPPRTVEPDARDCRNRGGSCGLGGGLGGGRSCGSLLLRGAAGAQGERGRSDESGGCQDASCDDHEPNRTGKNEGRTLFW